MTAQGIKIQKTKTKMDNETAMAVVRDNTLTYIVFAEANEIHATSPPEIYFSHRVRSTVQA